MSYWIGPTVKHEWIVAMHLMHIFNICHKTIAYHLGQYSLHHLLLKRSMPSVILGSQRCVHTDNSILIHWLLPAFRFYSSSLQIACLMPCPVRKRGHYKRKKERKKERSSSIFKLRNNVGRVKKGFEMKILQI